jgi:methylglutaconyl-CoA hydratase
MTKAPYQTITVETAGDVARVWLSRPDVRNAFNEIMIAELREAFESLGRDAAMRVIVLGGTGGVFCAGADVEWMRRAQEKDEAGNLADARAMAEMYRTIDECPAPVIARVHKAAFGGALGLLAVCDMVVAEAGTRLGFTEVRLGIVPAVISTFTIAKIGTSQARRYFLTGESFTAESAPAGLIHAVVPQGKLDEQVAEWVTGLRQAGPQAVREIKSLLRKVAGLPRAQALDLCAQTIAEVRVGKEAAAGLKAFLEKGPPPWLNQSEVDS